MICFVLPNLASSKVTLRELVDPPTTTKLSFLSKDAYRDWCSHPETDHVFLSLCEAVSPHLRVSAANPPYRIYGLVGEYDATVPADWEDSVRKAATPPEWTTRTFSGHGRVYWSFENPVDISHPKFAEAFFKIAFADLKAKRLGPGFELEESSKPAQYFEVGHPWTRTGLPLPDSVVEVWKYKAAQKVAWNREAVAIPIERVRAEAERRWPGRWPGGWDTFAVGSRGVRFWDPDADAPSVLVTESGCVCFTGDKTWVPWGEIFGPDWVRRQSDDVIGTALANFWCESAAGKYWRKTSSGQKIPIPSRTDLALSLEVAGLSAKAPRGETLSEVDRAIFALQDTRHVDGVHYAFYHPSDTIRFGTRTFLNVSNVRPGKPAPDKVKWGEEFPFIARLMDSMLREQLAHFLSVWAHFYQHALHGEAVRGLAVCLCGPPGTGKTFLCQVVLAYICGAREDAGAYILGDDQFNSHLVGSPLWVVDDAVVASDRKRHAKYTQLIKYVVANDSIKMRGMYREGYTAPWNGRLVLNINDDPESLGNLPALDMANVDKMAVYKVYPHDLRFPPHEDLLPELPFFAAFLRDFAVPGEFTSPRFGVKAYQHPELILAAAEASDTLGAEQLILLWRRKYFAEHPAASEWTGSATDLLTELEKYDELRNISARQIPTVNAMGRYLAKLEARGEAWLSRGKASRSGHRPIRIVPPSADD